MCVCVQGTIAHLMHTQPVTLGLGLGTNIYPSSSCSDICQIKFTTHVQYSQFTLCTQCTLSWIRSRDFIRQKLTRHRAESYKTANLVLSYSGLVTLLNRANKQAACKISRKVTVSYIYGLTMN